MCGWDVRHGGKREDESVLLQHHLDGDAEEEAAEVEPDAEGGGGG